jgi:HEAT repeat protein
VTDETPVDLVRALQRDLGAAFVATWCADLLSRRVRYDDPDYPPLARLAGRSAAAELRRGRLEERGVDYWPRVWAARGLLHGWDAAATVTATPAIVNALSDDAWRVREMAAKVARRWEIGEAADRLADLVDDDVPRVRAAAVRALAVVGESEHVDAVESATDDPETAVRAAAEAAIEQLAARLDRPLR